MEPKLKVLLIEDEPLVTFLFEDILEDTEFSIDAVMTSSGPVLRHLNSDIPDVAIVDLILEDGSCMHVIERLLELKVPTVVVSGHADAEVFSTRDGASFVAKPFWSKKLLATLRAMVTPNGSSGAKD
jgi:DNA-binding response OmpR family regulator